MAFHTHRKAGVHEAVHESEMEAEEKRYEVRVLEASSEDN